MQSCLDYKMKKTRRSTTDEEPKGRNFIKDNGNWFGEKQVITYLFI